MNSRSVATTLFGLVILVSACKKDPPRVEPGVPQGPTAPPVDRPPPPPPVNPTGNNTPGGGTPEDMNAMKVKALGILAEKIHFDFDAAVISSADMALLDQKAAIMRKNPALKIRISGHCDERGSDSYNLSLGFRRAEAARDYLVKAGVNANNIETTSLGREAPIDRGGTEAAWAQNRRDEFEATAGTQTIVMP